MAKTRREFTPEFKREAVALLDSSGRPQMQIAAELGDPTLDAEAMALGADGWLPTTAGSRVTGSRASEPGGVPLRPSR